MFILKQKKLLWWLEFAISMQFFSQKTWRFFPGILQNTITTKRQNSTKIAKKGLLNQLVLLPEILGLGLPDRITRNTRYDNRSQVTWVPVYQSLTVSQLSKWPLNLKFFPSVATSEANGLNEVLDIRHDVLNYHEITEKINEHFDLVIGEPHFSISSLPWHNLFYWYMLKSLTSKTISPLKATVWALPVQFKDLWKIRSPLNEVEGFNVKYFDEIILKACDIR